MEGLECVFDRGPREGLSLQARERCSGRRSPLKRPPLPLALSGRVLANWEGASDDEQDWSPTLTGGINRNLGVLRR